jgi:demethylmenaquinone methyltransferase/2-methoxy-6-polyprenyl-1,4-benzoquinol methylase
MALPYPEQSFDVASIAFGIRNVDDPQLCLREMARVVRPGGRVVVLEFGQPKGLFGALYRFYSRVFMPRIGALLTGNRAAFQYLPKTAASFPSGERFLQLMRDAGVFSQVRSRPLTFGVAHIYVGVRA